MHKQYKLSSIELLLLHIKDRFTAHLCKIKTDAVIWHPLDSICYGFVSFRGNSSEGNVGVQLLVVGYGLVTAGTLHVTLYKPWAKSKV